MKSIITLLSFFVSSFLVAQSPDIILHNGKIFTSDKSQLYVQAIAITGDKISAIGNNDEILKLKNGNTNIIDLAGKTVVPGFNDAHDHAGPEYPGRTIGLWKMPGDPTPWEKIKDSIIKITNEIKAGTLIRANIDASLMNDPRVSRNSLDSIAPLHPVLLNAWTGHGVIGNSKAFELLGYNENTRFLGGNMPKDATGQANGVMEEYAEFQITALLANKLPMEVVTNNFKGYYAEALSFGITSDQVMTTGLMPPKFVQVYSENDFGVRSRIIPFLFTNEKELLFSEWVGHFKKLNAKNVVSGVKLILDGTPDERLAAMSQPYTDKPGYYGHMNLDEGSIKSFVDFCLKHDQQIMVHAVGDSAIHSFIRILRSMHPDDFWKDKRVRLEHGDLAIMKESDLTTIKKMGIIIVVNPTHFAIPQIMGPRLGNRTVWLQAMRSLTANGIPWAIGSDGPMNPFLNLMLSAIHPNNPKEAVSIEQAVIAYTYGSAYAEFKEKEKGSLSVGKYADLAVLSQDIFTIPVPQLMGTKCVMTMVGGKILHR
jgi:predicted amidohydrolase YtcJ